MSARRLQCLLQLLAEAEHVFKAVVERDGRRTYDVRLAPVAGNAIPGQPLKHFRAPARADDAERKLATARRGDARRDELHRRPEPIQQELEISRELDRLVAQPIDSRLLKQRERRNEWRRRKN